MKFVTTSDAPAAIGPYSQAVVAHGLIYTSGQLGLLPDGTIADESVEKQMYQIMKNLYYILDAAGSQLTDVIKTTIYLEDMRDFEEMNKIYSYHFKDHKPARTTIAVRSLPMGVKIMIDCIAVAHSNADFG
jgi:2-iminobutanoate/2-iminopropanoate deaminase